MICPTCKRAWDGVVRNELDRAVREDATYHVEVQPLREPVDPDAKVLRIEIGPRP